MIDIEVSDDMKVVKRPITYNFGYNNMRRVTEDISRFIWLKDQRRIKISENDEFKPYNARIAEMPSAINTDHKYQLCNKCGGC